eukprot:7119165-Pyramimonas_sp.AAC.1
MSGLIAEDLRSGLPEVKSPLNHSAFEMDEQELAKGRGDIIKKLLVSWWKFPTSNPQHVRNCRSPQQNPCNLQAVNLANLTSGALPGGTSGRGARGVGSNSRQT